MGFIKALWGEEWSVTYITSPSSAIITINVFNTVISSIFGSWCWFFHRKIFKVSAFEQSHFEAKMLPLISPKFPTPNCNFLLRMSVHVNTSITCWDIGENENENAVIHIDFWIPDPDGWSDHSHNWHTCLSWHQAYIN